MLTSGSFFHIQIKTERRLTTATPHYKVKVAPPVGLKNTSKRVVCHLMC